MFKCGIARNAVLNRITSILVLLGVSISLCSCSVNKSSISNGRFDSVKHITVGVDNQFGRFVSVDGNIDSIVDLNSSVLARYIHDSVLEDCNIDVEFIGLSGLGVSSGSSPDVSTKSNISYISTYYRMTSVENLAPYLDEYSVELTSLISLLGEDITYSCSDTDAEVWCLKSKRNTPVANVTFIRSDWLEKLKLEAPSTREELETCLESFLDNADLLLGEDASKMIPFMIDNKPNESVKPLFDSFYDPSMDDRYFYENGYCRATQDEYSLGLKVLNDWYLSDLIPSDYSSIGRFTKEYYEPIENGYVGAFCSTYDYLYAGEEPHIDKLHKNCGDSADYIAVNTFENAEGVYTYWQEDYLELNDRQIFIPTTCTEPLACLVYLNWISDSSNIQKIMQLSMDNTDIHDPYSYERFLITTDCKFDDELLESRPAAAKARTVAEDVEYIHRGNKCVRYGPTFLKYCVSDLNFDLVYPSSLQKYNDAMICASDGEFDKIYQDNYDQYLLEGAGYIKAMRESEWEKVIVNGNMSPW